jgi:hypothetical protein
MMMEQMMQEMMQMMQENATSGGSGGGNDIDAGGVPGGAPGAGGPGMGGMGAGGPGMGGMGAGGPGMGHMGARGHGMGDMGEGGGDLGGKAGVLPEVSGSSGGVMGGGSGGQTSPGNLVTAGQPMVQQAEHKALNNFAKDDPSQFQAFESALSQGNATGAAQDLTQAVNSGALSRGDGAALATQINSTAEQYGGSAIGSAGAGGPLNGAIIADQLNQAVGSNVLSAAQ